MKKKISVVIPCYNEEKSVHTMYSIITKLFQDELSRYDYELIFVDDYSLDSTRAEIKKICGADKKVKAVLNVKNFGFLRNTFASLLETSGDVTFMVFGDLQDPPQLLPDFVEQWEQGYKVVLGQKTNSCENQFVYFLRTIYYKIIEFTSTGEQIAHFNGFGLYDKEFIDILHHIDDPQPYFKGIIAEFGLDQTIITYNQEKSARKFSNFNFARMYDVAMMGITTYTKTFMRSATFIGGIIGVLSLCVTAFSFIAKIFHFIDYPLGIPTLITGVFFFGAVQLFFIGILGEYVLSINARVVKRPLTVARRINY